MKAMILNFFKITYFFLGHNNSDVPSVTLTAKGNGNGKYILF